MKNATFEAEKPAKKKKPVLTFRLRKDAGPHYEQNLDFDNTEVEDEDNPRSIEFLPGDTIKSRRRLDKIFPNKFVLTEGEAQPHSGAGGDSYEVPEDDPDRDRPVRSKESATRRQVGRYLNEEELEGHPLQKLAKRVNRTRSQEATEKYGEDVTGKFEGAKEADFVVYKKGERYAIADADEPGTMLRKGLRQAKVSKALKQLQQD